MDGSPDPQHLVFAPNGNPVQFYLWGTNEPDSYDGLSAGQRKKLTQQIEENGGELCNDATKADTVIVHEHGHAKLKARYALVPRYAEMPTFVNKCIKDGKYEHGPQVTMRAMGGRPPGTFRQEYTPEDDRHLVEYLATAIPDPDQGGRSGNAVWKRLVNCVLPEFKWARRHTWQSWRNHYKTQKDKFDPQIAKEVKRNPPPKDGKGRFEYDRRVNKRSERDFWEAQEQAKDEDEGYNEFEESGDDGAQDAPAPSKRRRTDSGSGSDEEVEEIVRKEFGPPRNSRDASPAVLAPPPQRQPKAPVAANRRKKGPAPRPVVRLSNPNPAASQIQTSAPMSSQVTLVGLVPTQMRNAPPSQQQAEAGPGPRTVALRNRRDAKKREEDEEDEDENEDEDEEDGDEGKGQDQAGASIEEQPASATVLQTNDEHIVEHILDLTDDTELDTDDERTRRSILPSNAAAAARAVPLFDGDDEEEFARTYVTVIQTSRRASVAPATSLRVLRDDDDDDDGDSTSSHESAVPLPYTRASAEKRKRLAYVPPPDTRAAAAAVSATSAAERRISGKVLRSRTVPRQR